MRFESLIRVESGRVPGVVFVVRRVSFGRRVELMRAVRGLAERVEFLEASPGAGERMEAVLVWAEIDRLYLRWGLAGVEGLEIDGSPATPASLAEAGPEELFREALAAVKAEIGLTEAERKN